MATGADRGLLEEQHAQSVYKHAILGRYLTVFAAKVSSQWERIVLVDGFAGTGRSGTALGSAGLMVSAAGKVSAHAATTIHLVEQDKTRYDQLSNLVTALRRENVTVVPKHGSIDDQLDEIVASSAGAVLFLFLDPCGALLPFNRVVGALTGARLGPRPPTEGFLNFSARLTSRAAGQVVRRSDDQFAALKLDQVCGGTWWREIAISDAPQNGGERYERVVHRVALRYAELLGTATGMRTIVVPVAKQLTYQPIYHLIFLTRSDHGLAVFADALGRARPDWIEAMPPKDMGDDLFSMAGLDLPTQAATWRKSAEEARAATVPQLVSNISAVGRRRSLFRCLDEVAAVYGGAMGLASSTQVGQALRQLVADGRLVVDTYSKDPMQRRYRWTGQP